MQKSPLLFHRRFWPLFVTQFLGALNDNFFKNALVIFITYKTIVLFEIQSATLVALAGGVFILPFFLFSATAGQIADKYEMSRLIHYIKWWELGIMGLAAVGFYLDNYYLLLLVLFLMGTQSAFFGPIKYSIIPRLVSSQELVEANALVSMGTFVAILIGTIIGGHFTTFSFAERWISLGLIVFAILGIFSAYQVQEVEGSEPSVKVDPTLFSPTWNILKMTWKEGELFRAMMGISWLWFLGAAILSLIPPLCREVFHANELVATAFLATFTLGMGTGGLVCAKVSASKAEMGLIPLSCFGMGLSLIGLFWATSAGIFPTSSELMSFSQFIQIPHGVFSFLFLFTLSVCGGLFIIPNFTYIQTESRSSILSRMIAGNNIWNALFMVGAAVLVMILYALKLTIPQIILILGLMTLVVSIISYLVFGQAFWRFLCFLFSSIFYKIEVKGQENILNQGPYVLAANHTSFVDWVVIFAVFRDYHIRFIIDHIYYNIPVAKKVFMVGELIPIATKKESGKLLEEAFNEISRGLKRGDVLGLFPEGWVTRDGKLRPFQPGILKVLKRDPVPVLPVVLDGLWGSFFSYSGKGVFKKFPSLRRRKIKVTIFPPIPSENFDLKELENLMRDTLGQQRREA